MIKRVKIRNFESHEDTETEFADGLNLVVGQSNQGKSAIVRAIAMVVANRFDKESVRNGCDFCSVTIETDKGEVTAERGESVNRWTVRKNGEEEKHYRNIGTATPPGALEVLGMGERSRGDVKELPNVLFQLEKHYMLSEVDGRKVTSSQLARMMDEAIGIGGMEELVNDMATGLGRMKKELADSCNRISELKADILDEAVFARMENAVGKTSEKLSSLLEAESLVSGAKTLGDRAILVGRGVSRLADECARLEFVISEYDRVGALERKLSLARGAVSAREGIETLDRDAEAMGRALEAGERLGKMVGLAEKLSELSAKMKAIRKLGSFPDIGGVESLAETCDGLSERASAARKALAEAREAYRGLKSAERSASGLEVELEQKQDALHALEKTLGKCPLCGAGFE